jgi:hypothetical protein
MKWYKLKEDGLSGRPTCNKLVDKYGNVCYESDKVLIICDRGVVETAIFQYRFDEIGNRIEV